MSPKTSSSSVQATASTQGSNGRTTRAMKAKEQQNGTFQQTTTTKAAPNDTKVNKPTKAAEEIDPTSHLRTQKFSNGKVLANSNGKSKSKQEILDESLEKHLKAQKLKPFLWGTQVAPLSKESMSEDFAAMGYSPAAISAMMKMAEPIKVDGCTQRPLAGFGKHVAGTGVSPTNPKKKPTKKTAVPPSAPAPEPKPEPERAAPKKRKADEISADPPAPVAPEPSTAAEERVSESVEGEEEGNQKRRRRPGRPKISAARVEDSGSE